MFINLNQNTEVRKAKYYLATPNKRRKAVLWEATGGQGSFKLGDLSELSLSIPYKIENDFQTIDNPNIPKIKEKMLIKLEYGTYVEWFIIDSIDEDSGDEDTMNLSLLSLGYELSHKLIKGYSSESVNAHDYLTEILSNTAWKIGTIATKFANIFRSFEEGSDPTALDAIIQGAETFGALILWDTSKRTISFADPETVVKFKGMTASYGDLLETVGRSRSTDEMVTRMHVYGSEDLTIHSVNPTGQGYIEDFSYYMYPFQRDANKNVISSSDFMSDALCHAILDLEALNISFAGTFKTMSEQRAVKVGEMITLEAERVELEGELDAIIQKLDSAKALEDNPLIATVTAERDAKQIELTTKSNQYTGKVAEIDVIDTNIANLNVQLQSSANFTPDLISELNLFIIEKDWRDDRYLDAQELYDDAIKKFQESRKPKVVLTVGLSNFLNSVEDQYYWDKLQVGEPIRTKYPQMNMDYMSRIIEIDISFDDGDASVTIANTTELGTDMDKLKDILYSSKNATSVIQNNKYKWDKVVKVEDKVFSMLTGEINANKQKIIAGVDNQIEISGRGMLVKTPSNPDEMVIIQSGIIALSRDGGETWESAIRPDGIVADRLIGRIVAGQDLIITNASGSFVMDENGAVFDVSSFTVRSGTGSNNLVDRWQKSSTFSENYEDDNAITPYEKKIYRYNFGEIDIINTSNEQRITSLFANPSSLSYINEYRTAFKNLKDQLFTVKNSDGKALLDETNMNTVTSLSGTLINDRFATFKTKEVELQKQFSGYSEKLADDAKKLAEDAQRDVNQFKDDVVYKVEIDSSNGETFRNGNISTVATAIAYRGKSDITSTLPNTAFVWKKFDKDGVEDTAWGLKNKDVGKQITITKTDVYQKAIFKCHLYIT